MAKVPESLRELIDNALADGTPCLLGTVSSSGHPEISPKGSMLVYDDETLAYWERSKRSALRNVQGNPNVVVYYRNPAKADRLPRGAAVRFYGTVTMHEAGPVREAVMARVVKPELDADPERQGVAMLIRIDRIADLRGNAL